MDGIDPNLYIERGQVNNLWAEFITNFMTDFDNAHKLHVHSPPALVELYLKIFDMTLSGIIDNDNDNDTNHSEENLNPELVMNAAVEAMNMAAQFAIFMEKVKFPYKGLTSCRCFSVEDSEIATILNSRG